jgi:hypothetical protein
MARKKAVDKQKGTELQDASELYEHIGVTLQFRGRVYGGLPKTRELIDNYVKGKFGEEGEGLEKKLKEEVDIMEETEKSWCGFKSNAKGIYLSDYMFKAMLREAATRLDITKQRRGSRQVFQHDIYIKPPHVLLNRKVPDGYEDFAGRV